MELKHKHTHETIRHDDFIAGLAKGLEILECFGYDRQRLNVTQVAEKTSLTRTAVRRHLKTLKYLGYLDTDGTFFWLTPRVMKFSGAYLRSAHLPKIAEPLLHSLSAQTSMCHAVVILDQSDVITLACSYLASAEKNRVLPYGIHNGNRIPAHTASNGKVILAHMPEAELNEWLSKSEFSRLTKYTITDIEQFKENLREVHDQGWALAVEEHEVGFIGFSIPVFDSTGKVIAGLNTVARKEQYTIEEVMHRSLMPMQEVAKQLRHFL
ncbi:MULTISPECIES: IclR family transcriptional regulator domain-containing protein [Vitreoscilla]|uniref:Helix-turn-helix domain-containing protein n=1 Tax=Vitreoscilla stercoraria TaxID=61 RepID=A0ABY4EFC7_VITST|nr:MULTISPECIES: IclR family transcriptional regulator C-terminal domain-containing protein [Vitreoscilla]UOO93615.1 helix-turn-helix domain-containing protein [Vitreoscilla stercoraria]